MSFHDLLVLDYLTYTANIVILIYITFYGLTTLNYDNYNYVHLGLEHNNVHSQIVHYLLLRFELARPFTVSYSTNSYSVYIYVTRFGCFN